MNTSADLLKELRIDRKAPPPEPTSRRGLWITLGVIAVLLALAAAGWALFGREKPIEVRTAPTVAMGNGGAAASVLDASGYVVARRMATVSAKITGKVREVLIEEGMKVDAGQVMATLDPVDADASRALSQAQVEAAQPGPRGRQGADHLPGIVRSVVVDQHHFEVAHPQGRCQRPLQSLGQRRQDGGAAVDGDDDRKLRGGGHSISG